jgi:hypothetical protein
MFMKKFFSVLFFTLITGLITAQISKEIVVASAGELSNLLTNEEKYTITELIVTGNIDARDFWCMRDEIPNLEKLDLGSTNIVAYNGNTGLIEINNTTLFDENKLLSRQSTEFRNWYYENYCPDILQPEPISYDEYFRPSCYRITYNNITVTTYPIYQCACAQSWARSDFSITIEGAPYVSYPSNEVPKFAFYPMYPIYDYDYIMHPHAGYNSIGKTSLINIILPNSCTSLGNCSFKSCTGLASIYSFTQTPANLNSSTDVFKDVDKNTCILYVPTGSKDDYEAANQWQDFTNIVEMTTTEIENSLISNCKLKVYGAENKIIIEGISKGETVTIYTVNGKQIQTVISKGERLNISVDRDTVYLVKTRAKIFKVIL